MTNAMHAYESKITSKNWNNCGYTHVYFVSLRMILPQKMSSSRWDCYRICHMTYEEAKFNWYLNQKSIHCSRNVEYFLLKQLNKGDVCPVNNQEFWVLSWINRSNFWNKTCIKQLKKTKIFHHVMQELTENNSNPNNRYYFSWRI